MKRDKFAGIPCSISITIKDRGQCIEWEGTATFSTKNQISEAIKVLGQEPVAINAAWKNGQRIKGLVVARETNINKLTIVFTGTGEYHIKEK